MAPQDQGPDQGKRNPASPGKAVAFIVFKMIGVSVLAGMGVFLIVMGGLHPAAVLKSNLFTAADSPQAFRMAWQAGLGTGFITFAMLWIKMR